MVRKPKTSHAPTLAFPSKATAASKQPAPVPTEPALTTTASLKACTSNTADFTGVLPSNLAHVGEVDSEPEVEDVARVQDYEVEGTPAVISEAGSDITSSEDETKVW